MKALVLVAGLAGCAAQSIGDIGIACTADTDCPETTWCDLRYTSDRCLSLETSGPPHIAFDGFLVGGQVVPTISAPTKTLTIHTMRMRNDGGSQSDVVVKVEGPACVDAASLTRSDGELVDQGKELDADFDVDPAVGCASPVTLAITATASSRVFTYTAMISLTP